MKLWQCRLKPIMDCHILHEVILDLVGRKELLKFVMAEE